MQRALFLDVVVGQGAAIFELLAGEDQALLVWWDTLFILDFGLDVVDGVGGLDLEGDSFTREGFDEAVDGLVMGRAFAGRWERTSAL
jgi:hypothetical protein